MTLVYAFKKVWAAEIHKRPTKNPASHPQSAAWQGSSNSAIYLQFYIHHLVALSAFFGHETHNMAFD
jgi:hypothetical protein